MPVDGATRVPQTELERAFMASGSQDVPPEIATLAPRQRDASTFEALNERLGGVLYERDGDWFRKVPTHIGPDGVVWIDGELKQKVVWQERGVTLTKQAAQESTRNAAIGNRSSNDGKPLEFDWHDGWTWWRRGIKPEKDIQIMRRHDMAVETTYEDVDPTTAASYQQMSAHREAVKPAAPVRRTRRQAQVEEPVGSEQQE